MFRIRQKDLNDSRYRPFFISQRGDSTLASISTTVASQSEEVLTWTHPNEYQYGDGRGESGGKLKPPREVSDAVPDQVGAEADEDTEGNPKLKTRDEPASDYRRSDFGRVDGDSRDLDAHAQAHEEPAYHQTPPVLRESLGENGKHAEKAGDEDGAAATEVVVDGIGRPGAQQAE